MWDGSTSKISQQTLIQSIQNGGLKLCHFETQVKALKLCWVKRLCCNDNATWTILPQVFHKCSKLNILFSRNHVFTIKIKYSQIHTDVNNLYIEHFKKRVETLNQSLWHNSFLNSNTDTLFLKSWSNKGINKIRYIKHEQGHLLCHN